MVDPSGIFQVSTPSATLLTQFRQQAMQMTVFNVGPGEAILLRLGNSGILVDGGARVIKRNSTLGQALRGYLIGQGVRLMAIVASHPHVDHLNALETLLLGNPTEVLTPGAVYYHNGVTLGSWLTETLAARLNSLGPKVIQQVAVTGFGQYPGLGGTSMAMFVDGLWRPRPEYKSIIMAVPHGQARFLLTGDVYTTYEEALVANPVAAPYLATTVLKITHHGSQGGTGSVFAKQAVPRISVASTAGDAGHSLEPIVRTRLRSYGVVFDTYRTRGDVTVRTDGLQRFLGGRQGVLFEVELAKPGVLGLVV
jgi:competence protein ComEC